VTLKEQINSDIKTALLGGDRFKADVLRVFKAVILNEEVSQGKRDVGLEDSIIEQLLAREVKKRNESAEAYENANRSELAKTERLEAEVLSSYLPEQLSDDEIRQVIKKKIEDMGAVSMSSMGQIIGSVKSQLGNSADGAVIAKITKELLS